MNEDSKEKQMKIDQTVDKRNILSLEFNRNSANGLTIFVKSSVNWKLFSTEDGRFSNIGKIKCYNPRISRLDGVKSYFVRENVWEYENLPNLNLLLADNIQQGVTFEFGAIPVGDEKIANWLSQFKRDVKVMYLSYYKPVSIKVNITSETVEKEEHE